MVCVGYAINVKAVKPLVLQSVSETKPLVDLTNLCIPQTMDGNYFTDLLMVYIIIRSISSKNSKSIGNT